jgi:DeoR family transcriptional regulator of aga operon
MTRTEPELESDTTGQAFQHRDRTSHWDRTRLILDQLSREGHVDIDALAGELHVSAATVRRDLDGLALKQLLIRIRGGAVTNSSTYDLPIFYNAFRHAEEKRRIAQAAVARVTPGTVIGLNGGTTTTQIARALALRPDLERRDGSISLTIVTNAVNIAHELTVRSQFRVVMTGGTVRPESYETSGMLCERTLAYLAFDEVILSCNGLSAFAGASCNNVNEASTGSQFRARSKRATLVVDSSKFDTSCLARMCRLEEVNTVISDEQALQHQETVRALAEAGVELVIARESPATTN